MASSSFSLSSIGFENRDAVARAFGVEPETVRRWEDEEGLPVASVGRNPLYDVDAIRAWLKRRTRARRKGAARRGA